MILPFSTQINGKPTYFVEKIQRAISNFPDDAPLIDVKTQWFNTLIYFKVNPKIHTIREDSKNRWKPGTMIDFFINCRQKDMFRFAPKLPVVSVQSIIIKRWGIKPKVYINDSFFPLTDKEVLKLAENDGFDTVKDFFEYFDKDFEGKIIHWTDFKY